MHHNGIIINNFTTDGCVYELYQYPSIGELN
uniref:Uncharacterized protein n=1 Tax=Anguilla anguilla TaxID=7936 RepID=A0A0E9SFR7_ANGAN